MNRALSCANSCLYGICHAAIVSAGYSPALGFIHTGKMLSFAYDIADLYKTEMTIPTAFHAVAASTEDLSAGSPRTESSLLSTGQGLERRVRQSCRDAFYTGRLLQRIIPDIERALSVDENKNGAAEGFDTDEALPGGLWDPDLGEVAGGINRAI